MTRGNGPHRQGPTHVAHLLDTLGAGGAEQSIIELLPYLDKTRIRVSLMSLQTSSAARGATVDLDGLQVKRLSGDTLWRKALQLRRLLDREDVDLLHTAMFYPDLVGRLACTGTRVPVLTSLVNTSYDDARFRDPNVSTAKLRLVQLIDAVGGRLLTTHFHAVTRAVRDSAVKTLRIAAHRITVVERGRSRSRLGVPGEGRRALVRRRLGIPEDAEVLLNVGRQEYQKGQVYLLEAAGTLAPVRPRLKVLIAGREGHCSPALRDRMAELRLDDVLRFLGHRRDVPDLLAASDIVVCPSLYEGTAGAVLEAMALRVPVVAFDIPPIREVAENGRGALLVEKGSAGALAAAVRRLLDDTKLREMLGARGQRIFEARFTIERSAERMSHLYEGVAACSRARSAPADA